MGGEQGSGLVYLNNAALGWPPAPGVEEAIRSWLSSPPEEGERATAGRGGVAVEARRLLAAMIGAAGPERIVFTPNATQALNLAILGLRLPAGALVVASVAEHNSVLRPLNRLCAERGIRLAIVGLDSSGSLDGDAYRSVLARGPRLVALSHASNVTGRVNEVSQLFQEARKAGAVTLLDASQTAGSVPVNVVDLQADLAAFPGHKGLHGPTGTGCLYVAPEIELAPTIVGGTGSRSDLAHQPEEMPIRLEAGTPNAAGLAGLTAALQWLGGHAGEARERIALLGDRLLAELGRIPGVQVFGLDGASARTGVVSFRIEGWDVEEAGFALRESFGTVCRAGLHCAPLIHQAIGSAPSGTIRFSVSAFNTVEEIDRAAAAARELSRCAS